MLKAFKSMVNWTNVPGSEWTSWEDWQRQQTPIHYVESEIFNFYKSRQSLLNNIEASSVISGPSADYFTYCFGKFAIFIVNSTKITIRDYFMLLIDLYDTCKGTSRMLLGDPVHITILRDVINTSQIGHLNSLNFKEFEYDYTKIHAHTVAQYSLSTLIMRFVGHYLKLMFPGGKMPYIDVDKCMLAYNQRIYGTINMSSTVTPSRPIPITSSSLPIQMDCSRGSSSSEMTCGSWPRTTNEMVDRNSCTRCKNCARLTDKLWGDFNSCVDCHFKRICRECGEKAIIISSNVPKCMAHNYLKCVTCNEPAVSFTNANPKCAAHSS